eukprot:TRINITY_DN770_c0_g1_i1.p1 TRINITY_DN770_c0_g1~~TRINITY_DN770_c0_g1_i1.p1  ORF type:complete len:1599 (-),score=326.01 TRINITY_DN770_c0_g1_i1:4651-9447(-)
MPRRPRAAALAAAATLAHAASDHDHDDDFVTTPPRRLRRASFRHSARRTRDLVRRRAHFERIAAHHVASQRARVRADDRATLSSATEPFSQSASEDDGARVALTADWAHRVVDLSDEQLIAKLRWLLARLQTVVNLVEAADLPAGDSKRLPERHLNDDDNLHTLAEALATERFITHHDDCVKLFTACCSAELLRICAPQPPVSQRKLDQLSTLFVEQLAVMASANDAYEAYRFSLLEQLATVKTFVIFCDDDQFVCDIFACFYAIVRPHQSEKARQYLADILISLLEEAEELRKDVLDAMLAPLVPQLQYASASISLAETVLHGARACVQVPLCSMLNESLRCLQTVKSLGTPDKKHSTRRKSPAKRRLEEEEASSKAELSEHHEHIAQLLVAINRIAPDVLIYVIPSLENLIGSSDESIRLASVQILAALFTSRVDVIESYPVLFAEFLNRRRDVSAEIRSETTAALGPLLLVHPKHADTLDDMLKDRAIDKDDHVRCVAVESIGKCIHRASEDLLKILSSRLCDKKPQVRKAALAQVCEIFTNANPSYSRPTLSKDGSDENNASMDWEKSKGSSGESQERSRPRTSIEPATMNDVLETRMLRLSWLPDVLLGAHMSLSDAGDQKSARDIEKLIFEQMPAISKENGVNMRAGLRRLAIFISQLSEASFARLSAIVRNRWSTRAQLKRIAQFRLDSRKSTASPTRVEKETTPTHPTFSRRNQGEEQEQNSPTATAPTIELRNHAFALATLLSARIGSPINLENCQKLCMTFATAADLKIFDKTLKAIHPSTTPAEVVKARQDVVSRLGSKSGEGVFFTDHVFPVCSTGVFSGSFFSAACDIAEEESSIPLVDREKNGSLPPMTTESGKRVLPGILRFLDLVGSECSEVLALKIEEIRSLTGLSLEASDSSADVILCGMRLICQLPVGSVVDAGNEKLFDTLEQHMMTESLIRPDRGGRLSKWGCRAYVHLKRNDPDSITKLGKSLAAKLDSFTGIIEAIVAPLAALSQLAKHASSCFKSCALECFDFSRALLRGTMNSLIRATGDIVNEDAMNVNNTLWQDTKEMKNMLSNSHIFGAETGALAAEMVDRRSLCLAELVQRAVKLLVYSLAFQDDEECLAVIDILMRICDDTHGDVFSIFERAKEEPLNAVKVEAQSDSSVVVKKEADVEMHDQASNGPGPSLTAVFAVCRLCAGRGVLYLSRQSRFFRKLTPLVFVTTMLLAQDSSPTVRLSFAKSVYNSIMRKKLQLRWSVALGLMAVEPVMENLAQARTMLTSIFRYRRKVYNHTRQKGKSASMLLLPESVVPDLIWVLAHLPGVELDHEMGFLESQKCLELFLDRLLESNEHAGILNQYIESLSIAQVATDRDGKQGTEFVIELSRIAGGIVRKKQAGRKWNLSDDPGRVVLPADMFVSVEGKVKSTDVVRPSLVELARKLDDKDGVESAKNTPGHTVSNVKVSSVPSTGKSKKRRSRVTKADEDENKLISRLAKMQSKMDDACDDGKAEEGEMQNESKKENEEGEDKQKDQEDANEEDKEGEEKTGKAKAKVKEKVKVKEVSTLRRSKRNSRGRKRSSRELEDGDGAQEETHSVVRRSSRNRRM